MVFPSIIVEVYKTLRYNRKGTNTSHKVVDDSREDRDFHGMSKIRNVF